MFGLIVQIACTTAYMLTISWMVYNFHKLLHNNTAVGSPKVIDATRIGHYDRQLGYSLSTWIYAVKVNVYTRDKNMNIDDIIFSWYEDCVYDPDAIIYDAIENAKTRFLKVLESTRTKQDSYDSQYIKETVKPEFKCDTDYDYHVLSKTLRYNDYVDMPELIVRMDKFMEGVCG